MPEFPEIPAAERVLLLPHCLRPSDRCPGRPSREGFQCPADCAVSDCPIRVLRAEAERLGYKGVCVAPGGALALRFVQEKNPGLVVAIACQKELLEGEEAVAHLHKPPRVMTLPLRRDGCVDTEVDLPAALVLLRQGLVGAQSARRPPYSSSPSHPPKQGDGDQGRPSGPGLTPSEFRVSAPPDS